MVPRVYLDSNVVQDRRGARRAHPSTSKTERVLKWRSTGEHLFVKNVRVHMQGASPRENTLMAHALTLRHAVLVFIGGGGGGHSTTSLAYFLGEIITKKKERSY